MLSHTLWELFPFLLVCLVVRLGLGRFDRFISGLCLLKVWSARQTSIREMLGDIDFHPRCSHPVQLEFLVPSSPSP